MTLSTTGPIGTSSNRVQFADNTNIGQQVIQIGVPDSTNAPSSVFLDGLGTLTLGNIQGGTVNSLIDVTACSNLVVAPGATINAGTSTLMLGADLNADETGNDGMGTLSIDAGVTIVSVDGAANAITLPGAGIDIDTSSSPAVIDASNGGVVIRSSLPSLPISLGGSSQTGGGISLTDAELAEIQTAPTGTVTFGDSSQIGNITVVTATLASVVGTSTVIQTSETAGTINWNSPDGIGTSGQPVQISAASITTKSSTDQWLNVVGSATANSLDAGSGTIHLVGGTLLAGSILSSISVSGTGVLGGTGAIANSETLSVADGGSIAPGTSVPGILSCGNVELDSGSSFSARIDGSNPGTSYDQLCVSGTISLDGNLNLSSSGFAVTPGETIVLIKNEGGQSVFGTFSGLPNGAVVAVPGGTGSGVFHIFYNYNGAGSEGTNDVALVALGLLTDSDPAANSVPEGAVDGAAVGITTFMADPYPISYGLTDNADGRFAIDPTTGVVSVFDGSSVNYETAPNHQYSITVQATDSVGATATASFVINITNIPPTPPANVDASGIGVPVGATNGATVGITVYSSDLNPVRYSLTDDAGGRFTIDPTTGVVSVANASLLNSPPGSSYSITVQANDGADANGTSTASFVIPVTDIGPGVPYDADPTPNTVEEGLVGGTPVGITVNCTERQSGYLQSC